MRLFGLKVWLQGRREAMEKQDWRNGYDWAAGCILRGEETPDSIVEITDFEYGHSFDRGARSAAKKLQALATEVRP